MLCLMVALFVVSNVSLGIYLSQVEALISVFHVRILIVLASSILLCYSILLARQGEIDRAARYAVMALSLMIHLQVNINYLPQKLMYYKYLIIPAIFGSLFLSNFTNLVVGLINLFMMVATIVVQGLDEVLHLPIGFLFVTGSLVFILTHHRDNLEKEKQKELAQHATRLEALPPAGSRVTENLELDTGLEGSLKTCLILSSSATLTRIFLAENNESSSGITIKALDELVEVLPWPLKRPRPYTMPGYMN